MLGLSILLAALGAPMVFALVPTPADVAKRATCTVASAAAAASVSSCSTVVISGFTVASGTTVDFKFAEGASVSMTGDIIFSQTTSAGPLITFEGTSVTFNGNGHNINGNGALYWDGKGTNGGVTKPHPFVKVKISGTFQDVTVLNSPAQAISLGNSAALLIDSVTVDNSAGDAGALGHNTDGFDCSESDVTIQNSVVKNQDDCIAINNGSNVVFKNNQCSGGHGISIGSIASGKTVSGVTISGNTVTNSMYGMRIKVDSDATSGGVSDVTYSGNTISGIAKYGFLISQSYSEDFGTPGTDTTISDINFTGATTTITVDSSAVRIGVDCGNCDGTWDWSSLVASGGTGNDLVLDGATISGGSYGQAGATTAKTSSTSTKITTSTTTKASTSTTTTKSTSISTKTSSAATSTTTGTVPLYGQCGGIGYTGPTVCASGTCTYSNDYYSQCI